MSQLPSRRASRLRWWAAFLLTFGVFSGCDHSSSFNPNPSAPAYSAGAVAIHGGSASAATTFAGGIPIGLFLQPVDQFGDRYDGAHRNIPPPNLVDSLTAIRGRGGRVVLAFAGNERNYKDADGHFSMALWQRQIDRYRGVEFSEFIDDGTVIAHYILDEPNDPGNWNGERVSGSTVETLALYSKQIWPNMATVVRVESTYLTGFDVEYVYLDGAWAQYIHRKGDIRAFIQRNIADAQSLGLELVVGLNLLGGGPANAPMTASEVQEWGLVLLESSHPCAFISYQYNASYLAGAGIAEAMDVLRGQAQNRNSKTCRGPAETPPPPPLATTTTIISDGPDPSTPGQTVTVNFRVDASGGTPGGLVTVTAAGGTESCQVMLSAGAGSCPLTLTGTGDRALTARYGGSTSFASSSATEPHTVETTVLQPVTITWSTPQAITYGTALGPAQLNATASSGGQSVPGSFSYQPEAGTVLNAGEAQTLRVTFTPDDPNSYEGGSGSTSVDVLAATPSLGWTVPASTLVGPLSSQLLNATATGVGGASLAGTFTYTPSAGQVLDAAPSQPLSVNFQPSDGNYTSATKTVALAVLYPWTGFFAPVDNGARLNTAKAGVAIPVRFSLGGKRTAPVLAAGSPQVSSVSCPSWRTDAIEQTVSASRSSLWYEASTGRYIYTWKTSTTWANSCRRLAVILKDGTRHEATFKFSS